MIQIGMMNTLTVTEVRKYGYILDGGNREILLPMIECTKVLKKGDKADVFIYNDQKESLKATMKRPAACVGQFAVLTVKDVTSFGAFLDWGIGKDLFLPSRLQKREYTPGEFALVYLTLDHEKSGILATTYIEEFLSYEPTDLKEHQKVELLVIGRSKLGYNIIVNDRYRGIVFNSDVVTELERGLRTEGYVKQIREDGKLDCTIKPIGFRSQNSENEQIILDAFAGKKILHYSDKSPSEQIRSAFGMSKKQFKSALGTLYRKKWILIHNDRIELIGKDDS